MRKLKNMVSLLTQYTACVVAFITASILIGSGIILITIGKLTEKNHLISYGWKIAAISMVIYVICLLLRRFQLYAKKRITTYPYNAYV